MNRLEMPTLTVTSGAAFSLPSSAKAIISCRSCSDFIGTSGRISFARRAQPDSNMLYAMTVARTSAWPMQSRSWMLKYARVMCRLRLRRQLREMKMQYSLLQDRSCFLHFFGAIVVYIIITMRLLIAYTSPSLFGAVIYCELL